MRRLHESYGPDDIQKSLSVYPDLCVLLTFLIRFQHASISCPDLARFTLWLHPVHGMFFFPDGYFFFQMENKQRKKKDGCFFFLSFLRRKKEQKKEIAFLMLTKERLSVGRAQAPHRLASRWCPFSIHSSNGLSCIVSM